MYFKNLTMRRFHCFDSNSDCGVNYRPFSVLNASKEALKTGLRDFMIFMKNWLLCYYEVL